MAAEMEKMRFDFAQLMSRQAAAKSLHDAELAELRAHAQAAPQLHAEIDVMCRKFDGQEVYLGLGPGFEDFILEYEQALYTESLLNQSRWTSQIKASVLVNFLAGKAARVFHSNVTQWRIENPDFNYENFKGKMKSEFGCRLNQVQLCKRLTSGKRPQDSWSDYLDYLKPSVRMPARTSQVFSLLALIAQTELPLRSRPHPRTTRRFARRWPQRPQVARTPAPSEQHEKKNGAYQLQKPQHHAGQKQQKQSHRTGQGQALAAAAKPVPKLGENVSITRSDLNNTGKHHTKKHGWCSTFCIDSAGFAAHLCQRAEVLRRCPEC
ncbi:hypothetical protein ON010_g19092 [Phytophthora cinnamomi]|nr:hypothetical protein ON010_g19092 [Phytophthora cinnamomi]